jgi:hypothetical protein
VSVLILNRPNRLDYGHSPEEIELFANHLEAWARHTVGVLETAQDILEECHAPEGASVRLRNVLDARWPGPARLGSQGVRPGGIVLGAIIETKGDALARVLTNTGDQFSFTVRTLRDFGGVSLSEAGVRIGAKVHLTLDPTRNIVLDVTVLQSTTDLH